MDFWHIQLIFLNSYWSKSRDYFHVKKHQRKNLRRVFQLRQLQVVYRGSAVVISHQSRCGKKSEKALSVTHVKPEGVEYKQSEFQDFLGELGDLELLRRRETSGHKQLQVVRSWFAVWADPPLSCCVATNRTAIESSLNTQGLAFLPPPIVASLPSTPRSSFLFGML